MKLNCLKCFLVCFQIKVNNENDILDIIAHVNREYKEQNLYQATFRNNKKKLGKNQRANTFINS